MDHRENEDDLAGIVSRVESLALQSESRCSRRTRGALQHFSDFVVGEGQEVANTTLHYGAMASSGLHKDAKEALSDPNLKTAMVRNFHHLKTITSGALSSSTRTGHHQWEVAFCTQAGRQSQTLNSQDGCVLRCQPGNALQSDEY